MSSAENFTRHAKHYVEKVSLTWGPVIAVVRLKSPSSYEMTGIRTSA